MSSKKSKPLFEKGGIVQMTTYRSEVVGYPSFTYNCIIDGKSLIHLEASKALTTSKTSHKFRSIVSGHRGTEYLIIFLIRLMFYPKGFYFRAVPPTVNVRSYCIAMLQHKGWMSGLIWFSF